MGSYFADKWGTLSGLPAAIAEDPTFFIVFFAIGLPLIWWKWRVIDRGMQRATEDPSHGLRTSAATQQQRSETGIGTESVLVMRPPNTPWAIWFGLIFFGGGAVFFALVVLVESPTAKDWLVFAFMVLFSVACMGFIEANQTRFIVSHSMIERRRVLTRRERMAFASITDVSLNGKTFLGGVTVTDTGGQKMRIAARFSGYRDLLDRVAPLNPKLSLMLKIERSRPHARTARG